MRSKSWSHISTNKQCSSFLIPFYNIKMKAVRSILSQFVNRYVHYMFCWCRCNNTKRRHENSQFRLGYPNRGSICFSKHNVVNQAGIKSAVWHTAKFISETSSQVSVEMVFIRPISYQAEAQNWCQWTLANFIFVLFTQLLACVRQ